MVDILKFQSITSTQPLIRNPNIFEIFNMNCSESSFLMIRERSCFQLDNGTFIVKIGLINNLNCLLEFLKQQQQKQIKTSGKLTYEFLRLNLPGSLSHLSLLNSLISSSNSRISEGEFRFDQLQKHFDSLNVQYAFGSEDYTGIVKRIKYDSTTNAFTGFPSLLDRGVPIKSYYQTDSFDTLKSWFNSIDKASLLNVHMIQPVQSTYNSSIPSPYLLSAYGIDNIATANDILQRWWYILFNQSLQRNVRIIGFSSDADPKYLRAMRLMSGFLGAIPNFQVHQHTLNPGHLVTKWRNRLSSATAELCLVNQPISINHLHDIIENDTYSKLDHGLRKSDINPKDRQNFSSCLKLTSNDLFNILNATVDTRGTLLYFQVLKMIIVAYIEKTTTIVEIEKLVFPVHYKHRVERQSSFTHSQLEIDEIDIEQVITDAYHHAVDMLEDDDNDADGDETTTDLNMNEDNDDSSINNGYTDEDEQNNTQYLINTTKKDFSGVKVADKVEPHIEHSYFKVKFNHDTQFLHKQTACWLLTEEKSKLSNDRLLRVQQVIK
ncbi:unnamed protein product [Rotaria socialis]|uniref:Uncharacterized protein n=1 Tax=Rotaria socialis TaxID=392032 RepID=A0A818CDC3_9BILA|nr:unnamed protein product [Rotaria socialis]CAF4226563.1 unnamed protein product [Rotaria socialis]CAF4425232.1 unnamed protein product [Rotaria socialis]